MMLNLLPDSSQCWCGQFFSDIYWLYRSSCYGPKEVRFKGDISKSNPLQRSTAFKLWLQHVILVGGFAASHYLFEQVEAPLKREGLALIRPDNKVSVTSFFSHVNHIVLTLFPTQKQRCVGQGYILLSWPLCPHQSCEGLLRSCNIC